SIIARRIAGIGARRQQGHARAGGLLKSAPAKTLAVTTSALLASARYRPGYYPGALTLISPSNREPGLPSLDSIWRKHARAVVAIETPGEHATMLSPAHAEAAAAVLTRCLPDA